MRFQDYKTEGFYDEMFDEQQQPRPGAKAVIDRFNELPLEELRRRQQAAEKALLQMGITFSVYGDEQGTERIFPFDIVPRIIEESEWAIIENGLKQRIRALNFFIDDLYHDQKILKDGIIPKDLVLSASGFRPECVGLNPPGGIWCHITGTDLVRGGDGAFYVLEDNLRCPSGVSYVLENRVVMKRSFPRAFDAARVVPVVDYPNRLLELLQELAPPRRDKPVVAVWTPGVYNSAYFEHSFLAQQMGVELVEGRDLVVVDDRVMMRTTTGLRPVDVLYRRIDDDFIDPEVFRADSMLGVPGLMRAYRAGRVALANAPGTGVADDKAIYAYVPDMIRYYLDQDAILHNVKTYLCWREKDLQYVLDNLDKLVVKKVGESGGYGMLVGPHASEQERREYGEQVRAKPRDFIAQPTLSLSRVPTLVDDHFEGRHVDLRPYILYGEEIYVMPGGLTRVALKKGSLVVNSSQGGGSKDTWVVEAPSATEGGATC
ncbi:MAG: circularly permuted type 2 ATP-grasp protein [Desulfuromonadales bacterium]